MDPPEGFVSYELKTSFGTLMIPDRKCAVCIARWHFFSCTVCCFTHTLEQEVKPVIDQMNEELNKEGIE